MDQEQDSGRLAVRYDPWDEEPETRARRDGLLGGLLAVAFLACAVVLLQSTLSGPAPAPVADAAP